MAHVGVRAPNKISLTDTGAPFVLRTLCDAFDPVHFTSPVYNLSDVRSHAPIAIALVFATLSYA